MPNTLEVQPFDRYSIARWYAGEHLKVDPGVQEVHYLPTNAAEREIRLVEVNSMMPDRTDASLEPIDFGVDMGTGNAHTLLVLDLTPEQWNRALKGDLKLPRNWSIHGKISIRKK